MENQVRGFDISHWQGVFDFAKAESQGYKFAYVKATEGVSFKDKQFKRNWKEAPKNQIYVGAYHFYRPGLDPIDQAEHFLDTVGELAPGHLPHALDLEVVDGVRNSHILEGALKWLELVHEKSQRLPIIYTGPSYVKERGGMAEFSVYPLWLAHYTALTPKVPKAWGTYSIWQYSSANGLDKNLFNGSLDKLRQFAGLSLCSEL